MLKVRTHSQKILVYKGKKMVARAQVPPENLKLLSHNI